MWQGGVALALAVGVVHIVARYAGARRLAGVLKGIPIALLALLVALEPAAVDRAYARFVLAGLVFSLMGDLWLVLPGRFVQGLASFLVAHLVYIAAFTRGVGRDAGGLLAVPFVLFGLAMLAYLWPRLGRDRAPVAVYVAVIATMGWRATVRAGVAPAPSGGLAFAGALLFMASDAMLALDRFARRFAAADGAVMATYYAAQTLIALSVRR